MKSSGAEGFCVDVLVPGEKIGGVKPVLLSFKQMDDVALTPAHRPANTA